MALVNERRRYHRTNVSWPVTMLTASGPIEGEVRNISSGGAFIQCKKQPGRGETFRLVIRISQEPTRFLMTSARVARSTVYDPDDLVSYSGMGVRFVEISDSDRQFLEEMNSGGTRELELDRALQP
jgi:c-di-GMP-binding flagellar brake protein YcgR